MKVIIKKADLDTCLTAYILKVTVNDNVEVIQTERASKYYLENPNIICIECGGSGEIHKNNFDHHDLENYHPPACVQALNLKKIDDSFMKLLVEYVRYVDEAPYKLPQIPFPQLSSIFSGMLMVVKEPVKQFFKGLEIIEIVAKNKFNPYRKMPELKEWRAYIEAKILNSVKLKEAIKALVNNFV